MKSYYLKYKIISPLVETESGYFCSGTPEERGLDAWNDQNELIPDRDGAGDDGEAGEAGDDRRWSKNALKLYDLPIGMGLLNR